MKISKALKLVTSELSRASNTHDPMHSPHEGFSVMAEEVDELWDEVKKKPKNQRKSRLRDEAKQVAAMALRFMIDLT